jgi:hypothetical protein
MLVPVRRLGAVGAALAVFAGAAGLAGCQFLSQTATTMRRAANRFLPART